LDSRSRIAVRDKLRGNDKEVKEVFLGNRLAGKVAFITGAGSGIGRGMALCMAQEGATIAIADVNLANARSVAKEIRAAKGRALAMRVDVTKSAQVNAAVQRTLKRFGKIDIAVNDAGTGGEHIGPPLTNIPDEDWDKTFAVNCKGIFIVCKAVMPHMKERKSGKIINISSVAGKKPSVTIPAYSASKAAVIAFTQALAEELAPDNIQVNAICPGIIWTPMWQAFAGMLSERIPGLKGQDPAIAFKAITTAPQGNVQRIQRPEDIGMLAVFLASDEAKRISGEAISVEGPTPLG
jgi:meso-butanediol dehydrogenase/(S,S)-butanediol dehydrogenase/diacetyl reductase